MSRGPAPQSAGGHMQYNRALYILRAWSGEIAFAAALALVLWCGWEVDVDLGPGEPSRSKPHPIRLARVDNQRRRLAHCRLGLPWLSALKTSYGVQNESVCFYSQALSRLSARPDAAGSFGDDGGQVEALEGPGSRRHRSGLAPDIIGLVITETTALALSPAPSNVDITSLPVLVSPADEAVTQKPRALDSQVDACSSTSASSSSCSSSKAESGAQRKTELEECEERELVEAISLAESQPRANSKGKAPAPESAPAEDSASSTAGVQSKR
ncbi:hypothetical protein DFH08DRAFT_1085233 [Mycena albidolilacea]|uniref:Uncharacterized protein n=1 Tax=Mycena albidolilacea TaxID=1033008 RepID=A0AAD6ZK29_9AGAR|nr:hypothetical protein DFH08DRAFT_1085233 [Mycena albidolilacea]